MRKLKEELRQRQAKGLYRRRRITETPQQPQMIIDGREVISFCSNDYLGLANHPSVVKAFQDTANIFGVGSGAAHLINGHTRNHHELEEALAEFTGRERSLLFSTGYMANLGLIQALVGPGDTVLADKLNHASLTDGALLSRARLHRYPHGDMNLLLKRLKEAEAGEKLIVTDAVFSMDGDFAPLPELAKLAPFLRRMFWVYGAFIFLCIASLGVISAVNYSELTAGGTLARSFCAFTAVFWGLRLLTQFFVFDASEYLTSWFYKAGYHGLTLVFIYQVAVYGYFAFAPGLN